LPPTETTTYGFYYPLAVSLVEVFWIAITKGDNWGKPVKVNKRGEHINCPNVFIWYTR